MYISHYVIWNFNQNRLYYFTAISCYSFNFGIANLFKGGSKKASNKLMQLRVILQFIAIIALVAFAYFFKN